MRQLFEAGFAPWASLFAGGWIANTYDEFFVTAADGRVGEIQRGQFGIGRRLPVDSTKEAILDSFFGGRCTVILIDDSITRDRSFSSRRPRVRRACTALTCRTRGPACRRST